MPMPNWLFGGKVGPRKFPPPAVQAAWRVMADVASAVVVVGTVVTVKRVAITVSIMVDVNVSIWVVARFWNNPMVSRVLRR